MYSGCRSASVVSTDPAKLFMQVMMSNSRVRMPQKERGTTHTYIPHTPEAEISLTHDVHGFHAASRPYPSPRIVTSPKPRITGGQPYGECGASGCYTVTSFRAPPPPLQNGAESAPPSDMCDQPTLLCTESGLVRVFSCGSHSSVANRTRAETLCLVRTWDRSRDRSRRPFDKADPANDEAEAPSSSHPLFLRCLLLEPRR